MGQEFPGEMLVPRRLTSSTGGMCLFLFLSNEMDHSRKRSSEFIFAICLFDYERVMSLESSRSLLTSD